MTVDLEALASGMNEEIKRQNVVLEAYVRRIAELEAALWVALDGSEVVVRDDTPRDLEWKTTDDGGRLVRRARQ